jgi:hypothetical protein
VNTSARSEEKKKSADVTIWFRPHGSLPPSPQRRSARPRLLRRGRLSPRNHRRRSGSAPVPRSCTPNPRWRIGNGVRISESAMPVRAPRPLASVFRTTRAPVPSSASSTRMRTRRLRQTGDDGRLAVTTNSSPSAYGESLQPSKNCASTRRASSSRGPTFPGSYT